VSFDRYVRQMRVEGFGEAGQQRLARARVGVIGMGALGSRVAEDLARAGVGRLRLVDRDFVETSNLHRQHLYDEAAARNEEPKALAAARALAGINSEIVVEPHVRDLGPVEADELLGDLDLIVDGTDNFQTRYLINDFAVRGQRPWVYGACVSGQAMVAPFLPGRACLRCVFPEAPPAAATPTCETAGILPPAAALVTALQCALVLRILARPESPPPPALVIADVWSGELRQVRLPAEPDAHCPSCRGRQFPALDLAAASRSQKLCGRNAVLLSAPAAGCPDLPDLAQRLRGLGCELTPHMLRLDVPEGRITVFPGGRAIVQGTQDEGRARALFDRYVGT
jgi:adenylyltransferase/sulfurtransferase